LHREPDVADRDHCARLADFLSNTFVEFLAGDDGWVPPYASALTLKRSNKRCHARLILPGVGDEDIISRSSTMHGDALGFGRTQGGVRHEILLLVSH
jgi:hypothetical protein